MSDIKDSKPGVGDVANYGAVAAEFLTLFPLIDADKLKTRHLFGLPLVSGIRDPVTGKAQVMTPEIISDHIKDAIGNLEEELSLDLLPKQIKEKHPFDKQAYDAFGFFQLRHTPVYALQSLDIVSSDFSQIFHAPIEWIETANLSYGQVNIVPLGQAVGTAGFIPSGPSNSVFFVNLLAQKGWIPAWWQITYTVGFKDGMFPSVINDLIGIQAALDILSELAATHSKNTSHSISIDSMSQSVSTPGPQLYKQRRDDLAEKKKMLVGRLRKKYGSAIYADNL